MTDSAPEDEVSPEIVSLIDLGAKLELKLAEKLVLGMPLASTASPIFAG